ncbi:hypothetical protein GDO78_005095 [Eleutherodactylus coqui]|uniref:Uncharacterized protein n=1 Tax=Eleutherodactylus coqui TaxID=57060 RepID=A0A8J6FL42_ELECQ|nr:hypothetical protein GDO78_005095 [Eleutherodactylus coqui]
MGLKKCPTVGIDCTLHVLSDLDSVGWDHTFKSRQPRHFSIVRNYIAVGKFCRRWPMLHSLINHRSHTGRMELLHYYIAHTKLSTCDQPPASANEYPVIWGFFWSADGNFPQGAILVYCDIPIHMCTITLRGLLDGTIFLQMSKSEQ